MRLGIPAAYDRMGTYHMNGTGVRQDATRAYAFWQRAAEMGNPQAMDFLGEKLGAYEDMPADGLWANNRVALKMLECAVGQGYGDAAFNLAFGYTVHHGRSATKEEKARALQVLHDGVKLGCEMCANRLAIQFYAPYAPEEMLPPHIDKARGERYRIFSDALGRNHMHRFPNLDMVLPLPPADLPPWNGDRDTLLAAAMGVSLPYHPPPRLSEASQKTGRAFLDASYVLRRTDCKTTEPSAPWSGYWQPILQSDSDSGSTIFQLPPPGLYQRGEKFDNLELLQDKGAGLRPDICWGYWQTLRHDHASVSPAAATGQTRIVERPEPFVHALPSSACPISGIWQPWTAENHPLAAAVNQYWRQTWLHAGQSFPSPQRDWLLDFPENDLTWHLLDASAVSIHS
jgi:hypothetical protein